eukprot:624604-Amorphochlora_amoeboformis.AAC.1
MSDVTEDATIHGPNAIVGTSAEIVTVCRIGLGSRVAYHPSWTRGYEKGWPDENGFPAYPHLKENTVCNRLVDVPAFRPKNTVTRLPPRYDLIAEAEENASSWKYVFYACA